jgi:hypothetical protein
MATVEISYTGIFKDGEKNVIVKDGDDKLDYYWKATDWLPSGDTIASFTWVASDDMTVHENECSATPDIITAWISGGIKRRKGYSWVTARIVTTQGRQVDATLYFLILPL